MKTETTLQIGFAELALSKRKIKDDFFNPDSALKKND